MIPVDVGARRSVMPRTSGTVALIAGLFICGCSAAPTSRSASGLAPSPACLVQVELDGVRRCADLVAHLQPQPTPDAGQAPDAAPGDAGVILDASVPAEPPSFVWTELGPPSGPAIYVANGGDDRGPCDQTHPCASLAEGVGRLELGGAGARLHLARGSTFPEPLSTSWSASDVQVVGYGSGPRPAVRPPSGAPCLVLARSVTVERVQFHDFDCEDSERYPQSPTFRALPKRNPAITWITNASTSEVLLENVRIAGYGLGIELSASGLRKHAGFSIRGSLFDSIYNAQGEIQGSWALFAYGATDILIEGSTFIRVGSLAAGDPDKHRVIPPGFSASQVAGTYRHHTIYAHNGTERVTARNNWVVAGGDWQHRGQDNEITDSVFLGLPDSVYVGGGDEPVPGGVRALIARNVFSHGTDLNPLGYHNPRPGHTWPRSVGIRAQNMAALKVQRNAFVGALGADPAAILMDGSSKCATDPCVVADVSDNRTHNWGRSIVRYGATALAVGLNSWDTPGPTVESVLRTYAIEGQTDLLARLRSEDRGAARLEAAHVSKAVRRTDPSHN